LAMGDGPEGAAFGIELHSADYRTGGLGTAQAGCENVAGIVNGDTFDFFDGGGRYTVIAAGPLKSLRANVPGRENRRSSDE